MHNNKYIKQKSDIDSIQSNNVWQNHKIKNLAPSLVCTNRNLTNKITKQKKQAVEKKYHVKKVY